MVFCLVIKVQIGMDLRVGSEGQSHLLGMANWGNYPGLHFAGALHFNKVVRRQAGR